MTDATLQNGTCSLPAPLPEGAEGTGSVELRSAGFDLTSRQATGLALELHAANAWLLDWARLFTPGIPPDEHPSGMTGGNLTHVAATAGEPGFWNGQLQGSLMGSLPWAPSDAPTPYPFVLQASPAGLDLEPVSLSTPGERPLALRGTFNRAGYALHLDGMETPGHIYELAQRLPVFGGGLKAVLTPSSDVAEAGTQRVDIVCGRAWSAPEQTCTAGAPAAAPPSHPRSFARRRH